MMRRFDRYQNPRCGHATSHQSWCRRMCSKIVQPPFLLSPVQPPCICLQLPLSPIQLYELAVFHTAPVYRHKSLALLGHAIQKVLAFHCSRVVIPTMVHPVSQNRGYLSIDRRVIHRRMDIDTFLLHYMVRCAFIHINSMCIMQRWRA